jgi:muramoyltetrapeptide carboxypeptidase
MKSRGDSLIHPPALRPGDTVALICPGSRIEQRLIRQAEQWLRELGFCVAKYPQKKKPDSFFAASDADRAKELDWALAEPGIRAVFACRGGYGSQRALRLISRAQWQRWKPKLVMGYSDVTYLHQFLQNQLGWVSFHGPLIGFLNRPLIRKLMEASLVFSSAPHVETWSEVRNVGGRPSAEGRLVGGNLSLIQMAGPAELPRRPIILAIEDIHENFYRIDRMLQSLLDAGYAEYVRGILLGTFDDCGKGDRKTFRFERVLDSMRQLTRGPIWMNCRFGHGLDRRKIFQRILPFGTQIKLQGKRVHFLEPIVTDAC